jgi:hypothetical protein
MNRKNYFNKRLIKPRTKNFIRAILYSIKKVIWTTCESRSKSRAENLTKSWADLCVPTSPSVIRAANAGSSRRPSLAHSSNLVIFFFLSLKNLGRKRNKTRKSGTPPLYFLTTPSTSPKRTLPNLFDDNLFQMSYSSSYGW